MIWLINTLLAYGAKGMTYFPLCFPPEWMAQSRNIWSNSLLNSYGTPNEWYFYAAKANRQIAAIDHILMKSKNVGVMVTGNAASVIHPNWIRADEKIPGTAWRELTDVTGSDALIGCFDHKGKTALYVMNNSPYNTDANITLTFNKRYGYDMTHRGVSAAYAGTEIQLRLCAGEGVMITLR